MTWTAFLLLALSACTHAGWNLLSKRRLPSTALFMVASATAATALLPVAVWQWGVVVRLPASLWALVAATGFCQAVYCFGLAGAYRRGDLSLAYPLVRALPVVLVPLAAAALGQAAPLSSPSFVAGALLVVSGCLVLPLPRMALPRLADYRHAWAALAVLAALGTTGYTLIDDVGTRLLRESPGLALPPAHAALLFLLLLEAANALWLSLATLTRRSERQALRTILTVHRRDAALTGLGATLAYGLAVASMAYVSNVSYVAVFRQMSIPLGALLGVVVLGERSRAPRWVGIALVLAGLAFVAVR